MTTPNYEAYALILPPEEQTAEKLYEYATIAAERSYSPYSGYTVGAALLCQDGRLYLGANLENAAFGPTVCAERTAFFKAVFDGERSFAAIAVAGKKADAEAFGDCTPCGVCRQVMREFCGDDFKVILRCGGELQTLTLTDILPLSFSPADLA